MSNVARFYKKNGPVAPKGLAKYLATLHQGMSVQATSGASKDALLEMVELALTAWPK